MFPFPTIQSSRFAAKTINLIHDSSIGLNEPKHDEAAVKIEIKKTFLIEHEHIDLSWFVQLRMNTKLIANK